jgi:RNA polymerase sigma-70 factor, ECF subfamily
VSVIAKHFVFVTAASASMPEMTQSSFEEFYAHTARKLHGYLTRLSQNPAAAEEILQEAYVRMLHAPAMEEPQRRAYLYQTATNLLRDRWRRMKREQEWSEANYVSEEHHSNPGLAMDISSIFARLNAQERAILWLAHVEGWSHKEIGEILNVKEKSVRVMLFRAREKAKELFASAGIRGHHG